MNDLLDPQNEIHDMAHMTSEEMYQQERFLEEAREIRDGDIARQNEELIGGDEDLDAQYEDRTHIDDDFEDRGWPGDGSGMDDLADFGANEVDDYRNEE